VSMAIGSIVGWLVYAPLGYDCDYYVFADRQEAENKVIDFVDRDPDGEYSAVPLVVHPDHG